MFVVEDRYHLPNCSCARVVIEMVVFPPDARQLYLLLCEAI